MPENRLIDEKSPYLLQHAHNPVDWYPWGQEAFEEARRADKPIFLSIGYSTCHWCHVMERESFTQTEVADSLNRDFVAIKVDREERPDVDAVYMTACHLLNGSGGWPLSILMTPDQKPFWAGTYLPKHTQHGRMGLLDLLEKASDLWKNDREQLLQAGDEITGYLFKASQTPSASLGKELFHTAVAFFSDRFDPQNGGFGQAPKFPTPHNLLFLMRYGKWEEQPKVLQMAEVTLTQMARGGIFDQIGGGFSRYSTDEKWLAPHFEKMLYDNALLAYVYLDAFVATGDTFYRTIAQRTLEYVRKELTGPQGEFYCGQDADSDGEEGKYYLFTPQEVQTVLGHQTAEQFCNWYGVTAGGNFEGKSILSLLENPDYKQEPQEMASARQRLYDFRLARTTLHRDDKVLTAWNALMIAALAKAYRVLGNTAYLQAAKQGDHFILQNLTVPHGRLWLRWREGHAAYAGHLDDYAFYAWALLELYAADFDVTCLEHAVNIAKMMHQHFWDEDKGGFFLTADDAEPLITRPKEVYDGAIPSGNSVAGLVLTQLWILTADEFWHTLAQQQLAFLAGSAQTFPAGHCFALQSIAQFLYPSRQLVCVTASHLPDGLRELAEQHQLYTLLKTPENADLLAKLAPYTAAYPIPAAGAVFYLCQNETCSAPVNDLETLKKML